MLIKFDFIGSMLTQLIWYFKDCFVSLTVAATLYEWRHIRWSIDRVKGYLVKCFGLYPTCKTYSFGRHFILLWNSTLFKKILNQYEWSDACIWVWWQLKYKDRYCWASTVRVSFTMKYEDNRNDIKMMSSFNRFPWSFNTIHFGIWPNFQNI